MFKSLKSDMVNGLIFGNKPVFHSDSDSDGKTPKAANLMKPETQTYTTADSYQIAS